jgi:hypothetical protein
LSKNQIEIKATEKADKLIAANITLEEAYLVLGKQLDAEEAFEPLRRGFKSMSTDDLKKKAIDFLNKFGENILKNVCEWWSKNKETVAGSTGGIVAAITPIIAGALVGGPFGFLTGVIAAVAIILIKAGMDTVCPTGKAKRSLPWK